MSENIARLFEVGDIVFNTESGVRGVVLRFYTPTSCEEQTMVQPDDDKRMYHAPTSTWRPYTQHQNIAEAVMFGVDQMAAPFQSPIDARHQRYVEKFARAHGMSLSEASEAPMVRAHLEYILATRDNDFLRSATD